MIKVVSLVRSTGAAAPDAFGARWRDRVRAEVEATPAERRPRRLALCTVRPGRRPPPFDGATLAWYDDEAAAASGVVLGGDLVDPDRSHRIAVEERPVRGTEWLEGRWQAPATSDSIVLVVLLERIPSITRTAFRDYWWDHHRPFTDARIPEAVQPRAYVHNYPLGTAPSPWDGIGEMYEDSLDAPRERVRWLDEPEAADVVADEEAFIHRPTRLVLVADHEVLVAG